MTDLPRPIFTETSPKAVEAEVIALWEKISNQTLPPGAPERLMLNLITYRETLQRIGRQWGFEQCLVNFAQGDRLDEVALMVGAIRIPAQPSQMTLLVTRDEPYTGSFVVPASTIAIAESLEFATDSELVIPDGEASGTVTATCQSVGPETNGVELGAVSSFTPAIAGVLAVTNLTVSSGGSLEEENEPFRARTKKAPHSFTTAGTRGQYGYHTESVSPLIVDLSLVQPHNEAGGLMRLYLDIYPLTRDGLPSDELIQTIQDVFDRDDIITVCDIVRVKKPISISVVIEASITVLNGFQASDVQSRCLAALQAYADERRSRLGADIVREAIAAAALVEGVHSAEIINPPLTIDIQRHQWAQVAIASVTVAGFSEG